MLEIGPKRYARTCFAPCGHRGPNRPNLVGFEIIRLLRHKAFWTACSVLVVFSKPWPPRCVQNIFGAVRTWIVHTKAKSEMATRSRRQFESPFADASFFDLDNRNLIAATGAR